ncbi:MAG TPA: substrate binding domain-containing protein [Ramlibacter sp.]|nr:substrate binding domain-containing protein [Ramlibacter sp.]
MSSRQDLVTQNFDVAVWLGELRDSAFVGRRLSRGHLVVCAAPAYLQGHGVPRCPTDLAQHNCLLFAAPSYQNAWTFITVDRREDIQIRGNLRTDNGSVLLAAALAGPDGGSPVVFARSSTKAASSRFWRTSRSIRRQGNDDLYVVYPSHRRMSRKVRAFVDFLVRIFESPG